MFKILDSRDISVTTVRDFDSKAALNFHIDSSVEQTFGQKLEIEAPAQNRSCSTTNSIVMRHNFRSNIRKNYLGLKSLWSIVLQPKQLLCNG